MASFTWMVNSDWLALLGESVVRAAVLLGAAWVACWLLRRRTAGLRHLIWALSLAALVATPFSLDVAPKLRIPAWWQTAVPSVRQEVLSAAMDEDSRSPAPAVEADAAVPSERVSIVGVDVSSEALRLGAAARPSSVPPASLRAGGSHPGGWLLPAVLTAWVLGFLVLLARLAVGHGRVRKMARGATLLDAAVFNATVPDPGLPGGDGLARFSRAGRAVRFLQSTGETMPMTWGWRKPVVLLPASFGRWDRERRAMTIYHELAHVRRSDWLTQTLAQVVGAVYWFHPLVWLALGRMRIEADRACDDMVLRAGVKPSGYAGHLVQVAREFRTAGLRPWVAIAMAHPSSLNHRVQYVLDEKIVRAGLRRRSGLALALGMAIIVLAVPSIEAVGQTELPPAEPQVELELDPPFAAPVVSVIPAVPDQDVEVRARHGQARLPVAPGAHEAMRLAQAQQPAVQPRVSGAAEVERLSADMLRLQKRRATQVRLAAQLQSIDSQHWDEGQKQPRLSPAAVQTAGAALRKALGSSDANVRAEAAEALGHLGSSEQANLEALAKAVADSDPHTQRNAVESLGHLLRRSKEIPGEDAVRFLGPALNSPEPDIRREAAEALGRLRGPAAIDAATKLAGDADPQVQREAIESLGRLLRSSDAAAARSALPVLQKALQHNDPNVRRQLVETLGGLRSIANEVVPLLAKAAEDPDPGVQREAVEALGSISSMEGAMDWMGDIEVDGMDALQGAFAAMEAAGERLVEDKAPVVVAGTP